MSDSSLLRSELEELFDVRTFNMEPVFDELSGVVHQASAMVRAGLAQARLLVELASAKKTHQRAALRVRGGWICDRVDRRCAGGLARCDYHANCDSLLLSGSSALALVSSLAG